MNEYDHNHAIKGTRRGKLECPIDALNIIKTWTDIRHKNNIKTLNTKKIIDGEWTDHLMR